MITFFFLLTNTLVFEKKNILNRKESPARKKLSETEELLDLTHESSTVIRETTASTEPGNIHVTKQLFASFHRHCVQEKFRPVFSAPAL